MGKTPTQSESGETLQMTLSSKSFRSLTSANNENAEIFNNKYRESRALNPETISHFRTGAFIS